MTSAEHQGSRSRFRGEPGAEKAVFRLAEVVERRVKVIHDL